jgi:hypothetical protein
MIGAVKVILDRRKTAAGFVLETKLGGMHRQLFHSSFQGVNFQLQCWHLNFHTLLSKVLETKHSVHINEIQGYSYRNVNLPN